MIDAAGAAWGVLLERGLGRLLDRSVVRRLAAPDGVAVVAIGGSTLGGSGKTPLAIECAGELARAGARVALVGHAYRANPRRPRWVSSGDRLDEVGDEALLAADALEAHGARVVVAPSRADAMILGARAADVLVLDGVAQLAPVRATLALLSLDGSEPWGRPRALAPSGLLRAPAAALVRACDALVPMTDPAGDGPPALPDGGVIAGVATCGRNVWPALVESRGAWVDGGQLMTWEAMRSLRVGLLVALGRPQRIAHWLSRRGVVPRAIVRGRDHGPFRSGARLAALSAASRGIDVWLATPKCALHAARGLPGLPIAVIDHSVALDLSLRTRLRGIAALAALTGGGGTNTLELLESSRVVPSTAALYAPPATSLALRGEHDDMRPRA